MVRSYRNLAFLLVLLFSLGIAGSGRVLAGPSTLQLLSDGAGLDLSVSFKNSTPAYAHGFTLTGFVGALNLNLDKNTPFIGYCVDLPHFVSLKQKYKVDAYPTDSKTNGITNAGAVAYLANTYGPYFSKISDPGERNIQAAGLQIAIWSELYNNGNGFTSGVFQFNLPKNPKDPKYALDSAVAAAATVYLNDAQNKSAVSTWYDATPNGHGQWRGQSVILADPPPAVPEPPSVLLMGLGLLAVGLVYERKKARRLTGNKSHINV